MQIKKELCKSGDCYQNYDVKVQEDRFSGFTAWLQTQIDFTKGNDIKFTGVLQNEGELYSNDTGWFSCNVSGVYYVALTLKRTYNSKDELKIAVYKIGVNTGEERILTSHNTKNNPGMSNTNSRLVECAPGEYLVLQGYSKAGSVYGEPGVAHSTFTAFLMYKTDSSEKSFVGFSATKALTQTYDSGDKITFNSSRLLYDAGGHFKSPNNRTSASTFVCPFSGVYYVSVVFHKVYNNHLLLCVIRNSSEALLHSVDSSYDNKFSTSSNTAVIRCLQDETIAIEGSGRGKVEGWRVFELTTFTVMLLHADGGPGNSSFIGFSMYRKSLQDYTMNQTISFDGELMNEGNYFHFEQNHFFCPVDAVYYISLNAKKDGTKPLVIDVEVATNTVFRVQSAMSENPGSVMSNSALVRCFAGEVMRVRGAGTGSVYGHRSEKHTTFTVFMVHQY